MHDLIQFVNLSFHKNICPIESSKIIFEMWNRNETAPEESQVTQVQLWGACVPVGLALKSRWREVPQCSTQAPAGQPEVR